MPKSLIIQMIIGFVIAMIAITLFLHSTVRMTLSTEYHQIATDGTVTITPEPGHSYFISVESAHELTKPELESIHSNLIVTSDDPLGGFGLSEAAGRRRSSRTHMNNSAHKASVSSLWFTDNDPITLNISPTQPDPGRILMIQSSDELTVIGIITPFLLFLIGFGAGFAAAIHIIIWAIKKPTSNNPESSGATGRSAAG